MLCASACERLKVRALLLGSDRTGAPAGLLPPVAAADQTLSLRSTGGASAPTIRSSASCAESDGVRASWARSPTGNRRSTSPRPGSGTSPAPHVDRSTKRYLNIELLRDQQMRGSIMREPLPGAAQPLSPNQMCERVWILPRCAAECAQNRGQYAIRTMNPAMST
jgi:hypothetical protein